MQTVSLFAWNQSLFLENKMANTCISKWWVLKFLLDFFLNIYFKCQFNFCQHLKCETEPCHDKKKFSFFDRQQIYGPACASIVWSGPSLFASRFYRVQNASKQKVNAPTTLQKNTSWSKPSLLEYKSRSLLIWPTHTGVQYQYHRGEKSTWPDRDSNPGPLANRASTLANWATEPHGQPATISPCLNRFVPESARNRAGTDETVPLLLVARAQTHTEPPNVKGEKKAHGPNGTRTQDLSQTVRALKPTELPSHTVDLRHQIWPQGYKTFFMLNSAEHEICPANKSQITNNWKFCFAKHNWAWKFSANRYENANYCWHFHIY